MNTNQEIWKEIQGTEDKYKVSNTGKILNVTNNKLLKPIPIKKGNYVTSFITNNKLKQHQIHKLVGSHFIDNPNNLKLVVHLDGNKKNNSAYNLKWISEKNHKIHVMKFKIDQFEKNNKLSNIQDKFELWLSIPEYENYVVSNLGKIVNKETNQILNPTLCNKYYSVNLCNLIKSKKAKLFRVHRIVAKTFVYNSNPFKKIYVDHINNNKLDNRVENLRWITPKGNSNSYIKNFRKSPASPVLQFDDNMKLIREWNNVKEIIDKNPTYKQFKIYNCLRGRTKLTYGYIWKYKNKKKEINLKQDKIFKNIGIIKKKDFSNYEISNYGTVKNIIRKQFNTSTLNTHKGYNMYIHKLVALLFVNGKTEKNNWINHIDENKTNNYYKNLQWITPKGNVEHSVGKKIHQMNIYTEKIINTFNSINDATRYINSLSSKKIYASSISACCRNKKELYAGFKWKFAE